MTARDVLETNIDPAVPEDMARASIDSFATEVRSEVLTEAKTEVVAWLVKKAREYRATGSQQHACSAEAIEFLASKVDRGAVRAFIGTQHYRDAMDAHRAEVLAKDGQAFDGELAMLRGLVRTLRAVVRPDKGDAAEVRRLLWQHVADEAAARAEAQGKSSRTAADATPDFFQPGRTYRSRRCADLRFECLALSADPDNGDQQAIGWRFGPPRNGIRRHRLAALGAEDWTCCDWTETTDTTITGEDGAL